MIKWFRKKQADDAQESTPQTPTDIVETVVEEPVPQPEKEIKEPVTTKKSFFSRLKKGLSKTRQQVGGGIGRLLLGKKEVNAEVLEELETLLITADIGVETSQTIINDITEQLKRKELSNGDRVFDALKQHLVASITPLSQKLEAHNPQGPFVLLMVGINGAGKTTTIGKIAKQFQAEGKKVMLAAGDTFRAAAVEQLQIWGERNDIPVIAQHTGADSASVIYDALQSAKAKNMDILIADTAGRLHTQHNLMEELAKVKRVIQKIDADAPHEIMLVLDASIGQNAVNQAREFNQALGVTGITMTKLDGTARGGILFAIAHHLRIPFRYIGIGEGIDDLRVFEANDFVEALFGDD